MKKDKKLEETQELDARAIRAASSKNVKPRNTTPNKTSSNNSKTNSNKAKKPAASVQKKKAPAAQSRSQKKPAAAQKKSVKTSSAPAKTQQSAQSNKIRRFPKEEVQKQSSGKRSPAKKSRTIRKVKGIVAFSLCCIVVLAALVAFGISQLFKIKTITVNYDLNKTVQSEKVKRKYTDEQILNAAGVAEGDNLLLTKYAKAEKITKSVGKQLPFLSVVSVEGEGMSRLILNVKQIKPQYAFIFGDTYILTDDSLNVIDYTRDEKTAKQYSVVKYAEISSYETGQKIELSEGSEKSEAMVSLADAIKSAELKKITYISLKNPDDLYMMYDSRILIHVGNRKNITEKLRLAQRSLEDEDKNSANQKGELNLTIEKKAYFTPE